MTDRDLMPDEAARKWLSSVEWQESERNWLSDHTISPDLREAIDLALLCAFDAGARWHSAQRVAGQSPVAEGLIYDLRD